MTVLVDTLKAKKKLLQAGFTDKKAEGIVEVFSETSDEVATKHDLELLRKDMLLGVGGMIVAAVGIILAALKYFS